MRNFLKLNFVCLSFTLLFSTQSNSQNLGIGIRMGDPSGLTFKKYNGNKALEFSIGRSHLINGTGWYNKHYNHWYDDRYGKYDDFNYISHRSYTPIGMQIHYLIHNNLKSTGSADLSGLKWYYGFGGFFGTQKFKYDYRYKLHDDPNWVYVDNEVYRNIDFGIDGVLGLEYTFEEVPVSLFIDVSLYMELFDNPFIFGWFAGLGVRYNF